MATRSEGRLASRRALVAGGSRGIGRAIAQGVPLWRMDSPEQVAQMAVYLARDDAAWITGKVFRIDGGQLV